MSIGASVANVGVMVPVKLLLPSWRSCKLGALKAAASGAPVNALLVKSSCCSSVRFKRNDGISPVSWLSEKCMVERLVMFFHAAEIVPVNLFVPRNKFRRFVNVLQDLGRVPLSWFTWRFR